MENNAKDNEAVSADIPEQTAPVKTDVPATPAPINAEPTVRIKIPFIPGKSRSEQDDVFVGVNGKSWLIQRGKFVDVPQCVAEVLQHQEEMLETIMAFDEKNAVKE